MAPVAAAHGGVGLQRQELWMAAGWVMGIRPSVRRVASIRHSAADVAAVSSITPLVDDTSGSGRPLYSQFDASASSPAAAADDIAVIVASWRVPFDNRPSADAISSLTSNQRTSDDVGLTSQSSRRRRWPPLQSTFTTIASSLGSFLPFFSLVRFRTHRQAEFRH